MLLRVGQVIGDDPQELPARPVGFEQGEVEGLAQPGRAGVPHSPGRVHPCLRHADPRRVVLVEDLPPFGVDVMDLVPVPERMGPVLDGLIARIRLGGQRLERLGKVLGQAVRHIDPEPVDPSVGPEPQRG